MNALKPTVCICIAAAWALLMLTGACRAAQPVLQVKGPEGRTIELSIDQLNTYPQTSVKVEESQGVASEYRGVALHQLLKAAGAPTEKNMRGAALRQYVLVHAADGYAAVFALTETDPVFSDRLILLGYSKDAKPLPGNEGPFRLLVPAEKRHARWVRQIVRIEVRQAD